MDITIDCKKVEISSITREQVRVNIEDADKNDIYGAMDITDAIEYFTENALLDRIGKDKAREYWGEEEII